jgi:hypothetical protein
MWAFVFGWGVDKNLKSYGMRNIEDIKVILLPTFS